MGKYIHETEFSCLVWLNSSWCRTGYRPGKTWICRSTVARHRPNVWTPPIHLRRL